MNCPYQICCFSHVRTNPTRRVKPPRHRGSVGRFTPSSGVVFCTNIDARLTALRTMVPRAVAEKENSKGAVLKETAPFCCYAVGTIHELPHKRLTGTPGVPSVCRYQLCTNIDARLTATSQKAARCLSILTNTIFHLCLHKPTVRSKPPRHRGEVCGSREQSV